MSYRFKVFGLKTRDFLGELPFEIEGELTRVLQGYGSGKLALDVTADGVPENWDQLILPWRNLILVVDEDDNILWPGVPNAKTTSTLTKVTYPCVTVENYFVQRYTPSLRFVQKDQADIARALAAVCGDAAGIPLEYDCPRTGVLRDEQYAADEDGRVYTRLQELAASENGFNWTVDVEWANDDHSKVKFVFRTGYPHLGNRTAHPEHVFALPGNISEFQGSLSWAEGDAATSVQGSGDGNGETKLMSTPIIDTVREAADWPRLEERRQFSQVKDQAALDARVQAFAAEMFGGQDVVTVTVTNGLGTSLDDLTLGDSAVLSIDAPTKKVHEVPVVVGWSLSAESSKFKPTLAKLEVT